MGQWSAPIGDATWPLAIHTHVLPTGRVLLHQDGQVRLWDPANPNVLTTGAPADFNIFCAGNAFLGDGRLFFAGGGGHDGPATRRARIYNPFSNSWSVVRGMNDRRWYPTNVALASGEMLVVAGSINANPDMRDPLPQIWGGTPLWRNLPGAQNHPPHAWYPWLFLAGSGRVFHSGPDPDTRSLDTAGNGAWAPVAVTGFGRRRESGSSAMYDDGKVLILGGDEDQDGALPATDTAEIIDLAEGPPVWRDIPAMAKRRAHHNATLLPDGTVLVTGGNEKNDYDNDDIVPVKAAQIWSPATGWSVELASNQVFRGYHSTAVLLPDGRVLSGGGNGAVPPGQEIQNKLEIYSPPYLFRGPRPRIMQAPQTVTYGEQFDVNVMQPPHEMGGVTWVRLASVTHGFDQNQRFLRLPFESTFGALRVTAPSNPHACPPGHYLMFVLNQSGVPSRGRIIRITQKVTAGALEVDPFGNRVLEPGEHVTLAPAWANVFDRDVSLTGLASGFSGPGTATYLVTDGAADYGTIPPSATLPPPAKSCGDTGNCYAVEVSSPPVRPAQHWDATFEEQTNTGDVKTWTVHIGGSFDDVPQSDPAYRFVETLLHKGVTAGCNGTSYCPTAAVTREQMAVFLLTAMHGPGYAPRACVSPPFNDVPISSPFCPWIQELARRTISAGCGGGNYCPGAPVTRDQMAVLLLRTVEYDEEYTGAPLPQCTTPPFNDVPTSSSFCPWIQELVRRGITGGCGEGNYCPTAVVTRGQMAVFLTTTFQLSLYGP